jgi:3D (Asp-Asp-Asp) domain-containing protein
MNGVSTIYETNKINIKNFLSEIDFQLGSLDTIQPGINTLIKNDLEIKVDQSTRYVIHDQGSNQSIQSTSRLLGNILTEADISYDNSSIILLDGEISSPSANLPFNSFYDIEVLSPISQEDFKSNSRSLDTLLFESQTKNLNIGYQTNNSPNETLSISGISPQQYNFIEFEDDTVFFTQVTEEVVLDQYPISFFTIYQPLSTIAIDTETTVKTGEYGLEAQRKRIRYEDGIETGVIVEATWLVRPAVDRIVGYGTEISIQTLNTADGPIEYYRAVEFYATSYSASRAGVDPSVSWYGEVFCGGYAQYGYVAVDLDYIPCGTPLYVPGYGYAVAMDTGNFNGAWIDLGYDDDNWVQWSKPVTVYFLTPVPPIDTINYIIPPGSTPYLPGFTY